MEFAKPEVTAVEATIVQVEEAMNELNDLELSLVGGGVGDVVLG